ncbi:MAG: CBS domain-containing protein [Bacillota bacterium]
MKIKDVMTDTIASVNPNTTVVEAAQLMQKHDVGAMPVMEGQNIIGIITDRDIVVRNVAHNRDPKSTPVRDVMTSQVKTITSDTGLSQAATMMAQNQIRRLPVVDNNKLVGMVSLGDLATQAKYDVELADTLGRISYPAEPEHM